ncbi:YugN family protein [Bacillus sp. FJAT-50079]|uniref:YugN family protein n=1 Tax=Bacillus sp. FJAT-50079 TaxID=2833577 RepID=UPI001BC8E390|nr:YugN family protein [Bacillus sp. FJAT-50079]MBS4207747.1 hypothetical protein [Bacillus sp. FJAT-50079]
MRFENSGIESLKVDLKRLDEIMDHNGMIRAGQWDYERVTYDHKFQIKEGIYYFRIQGYAVQGDVGANDAVIQLMTPLLGKHYYPHGVEYGEDEFFPEQLVKKCNQMLKKIKEETAVFAE